MNFAPTPNKEKWTLIDAIAAAGDFSKQANKKSIELTRNGQTSRHNFNELRGTADVAKNPTLAPGDIIVVPEVFQLR